jgi:hypothetical protein
MVPCHWCLPVLWNTCHHHILKHQDLHTHQLQSEMFHFLKLFIVNFCWINFHEQVNGLYLL